MVDGPTITGEAQDDGTDELLAALDSSNKGVAEDFTGEEDAKSAEGNEAKEESLEKAPDGEGDKKEGEGEKEVPVKEDSKEAAFDKNEENRELKQLLRAQKRELAIMKSKLDRLANRKPQAPSPKQSQTEHDLFGPEETPEEPPPEKEELSPLELAQADIQQIAEVRGPILDALVEAMELNPKYSDVANVCSQANFEDMFEAMGKAISQQKGVDPVLAAAEAEAAVWKMRNPYRFMYDLIKKHHPAYIAKSEGAIPKKEGVTEKSAVPVKKEPVKAPSSIAGMTGKTTAENAWTAARIDEMDEQELSDVPTKVYEKYLRGELD